MEKADSCNIILDRRPLESEHVIIPEALCPGRDPNVHAIHRGDGAAMSIYGILKSPVELSAHCSGDFY